MHYLDNSATTAVSPAAAQAALRLMTVKFCNPSSLHALGVAAEHELTAAREAVARALGANAVELTFTSGGTEANNLAVFGAAAAKRRTRKRIVISATEHSSVMEAARQLADEGWEMVRISPAEDGTVHPEDVAGVVTADTALVSVMLVNNETGAINPVADIFEAARLRCRDVICHTDAVQAFGKLPVRVKSLGADLLTVSAHKVHAPKGCGALYVKKGVRILPRQFGGEQEKRLRGGTEALPSIAAFGVACGEFAIAENLEKVAALHAYAKEKLLSIDGVVLNSPENALPYVLNISAGRVRSETILHFLEEREIYVSSGSACAKGKPSHVLSAMGIDKKRADSALRISFSKYNTRDDVDALANAIAFGLKTLAYR
ncbi:MAG: cysteine desulfurase [Ruminococcus sp.]|nr:cysteine desulfurase [Ruminococcus sp.]